MPFYVLGAVIPMLEIALDGALCYASNLRVVSGTAVALHADAEYASVTLDSGEVIEASLVVGADAVEAEHKKAIAPLNAVVAQCREAWAGVRKLAESVRTEHRREDGADVHRS